MKDLLFILTLIISFECSGQTVFPLLRFAGDPRPVGYGVKQNKDTIDTYTAFYYTPGVVDTTKMFVKNSLLLNLNFNIIKILQKTNSDTLEIKSFGDIKFLKIGDRVYKIESPTLTEVKKEESSYWKLPNRLDTSIYLKPSPNYYFIDSSMGRASIIKNY